MTWTRARRKQGGEWTLVGPEGIRRATAREMERLAQAGELGPQALAAWEGHASGGSAPSAPPAPPASSAPSAEPGSSSATAQAWSEAVEAACRDFERDESPEPSGAGDEGGLDAAMRAELRAQGAIPRDEEPPPAA